MEYNITKNMIRFNCGCLYPPRISLMPLGAGRYWIREEPSVCQKHSGLHILQKDDVIVIKNGEYQCRGKLGETCTICEECANPIPLFHGDPLLGRMLCKKCHTEIENAWDQKGRVDPRYYSYDNSRIENKIEEPGENNMSDNKFEDWGEHNMKEKLYCSWCECRTDHVSDPKSENFDILPTCQICGHKRNIMKEII